MTTEKIGDLEAQAEPIERLEKRLALLKKYGVRTYRDGRLSIDLGGSAEPTKKKQPETEGDPLVRGM